MKTKRTTKSYASIQVVDRLVQLLDVLAQQGQPASLKILAADTGLHTSTAFRILASLESHDFVERDGTGRYHLGPKLLRLGSRVHRHLRAEARPILDWLREQLDETVNLTVPEGDEAVYIERAATHKMMRVEHVVGSRAPLHATAVGKLFLGARGPMFFSDYVRRRLVPLTPNTIVDPAKLAQEIETAGRQGYAVDNQEAEIGVGCIAVPVHDSSGETVAALSVSSPIERRRLEWIPMLQQAAAQLSQRLGYLPTALHERPTPRSHAAQ